MYFFFLEKIYNTTKPEYTDLTVQFLNINSTLRVKIALIEE